MKNIRYTWTGFYSEFADILSTFKDDRQTLIAKLQKAYQAIDIKLPKLDAGGMPRDIDPFTVFGLFNRGITDANRQKVVAELALEFNIKASLPEDFRGLPMLDNRGVAYYAFYDDPRRNIGDIDRLWDTFIAALTYANNPNEENRAAFSAAYDAILHQFGISWKITMGLYYVRPYTFVSLDSCNRQFLTLPEAMPKEINKEVESLKDVPNASGYLWLCHRILDAMEKNDYPYKTYPELSSHAWRFKSKAGKGARSAVQNTTLGDADVRPVHYWLYAPGKSAHMWDDFYERGVMGLGWHELGNLSNYATKKSMRLKLQDKYGNETSQKNSALAVWQFVHDIKPGDVIFAKRGRNEILGRGVVVGDYVYNPESEGYPNIRKVSWECRGCWHNDDQFAMKALTDVTAYPDFIAKIETFFKDNDNKHTGLTVACPEYSKMSFLNEVYMDEESYDRLSNVLRFKKNIILQGAPGVGKTFIAKRLAYSMMGIKDVSRVMMVQFHQSYSYEDFIEGYRPSAKGFELKKGPFCDFCEKAAKDGNNDYFVIIDEINRGNLSKIFGELFMLIENDKRGNEHELPLLYSQQSFFVPSNVYLIGMMNTADRSLAMLDYALRRRFAFFNLSPAFASDSFREYRSSLESSKLDALVRVVERLNEAIANDEALGEGFCIGHSYFCGMRPRGVNEKLIPIVEYELIPMLREYWFDEPAKAREWADRLHGALE